MCGICYHESPGEGLKLKEKHKLLAYDDNVNILGENIDTAQKNIQERGIA
jgi:hypothetical protein